MLNGEGLHRTNAWQMVRRRPKAAGLTTEVCNHTFRGTGITAYLENGGTLEKARQMAAHASTRTTQLYDRREDRVTLNEVEDQCSGVGELLGTWPEGVDRGWRV
jgi:integrase/recombinase XerD